MLRLSGSDPHTQTLKVRRCLLGEGIQGLGPTVWGFGQGTRKDLGSGFVFGGFYDRAMNSSVNCTDFSKPKTLISNALNP